MIDKNKNTGQLTFTVSGVPNPNPSPIANPKSVFDLDITQANIRVEGEKWILNSFDFVAPKNSLLDGSSGSIGMANNTDAQGKATEPYKSFFVQSDQERIPLVISNLKTKHVPGTCPPPAPDKRASAAEICRVPEPTTTLSLLSLGTLGAASTLKRKQKQNSK